MVLNVVKMIDLTVFQIVSNFVKFETNVLHFNDNINYKTFPLIYGPIPF